MLCIIAQCVYIAESVGDSDHEQVRKGKKEFPETTFKSLWILRHMQNCGSRWPRCCLDIAAYPSG